MKTLRTLAITTLAFVAGAFGSKAATTVFEDTFGTSTLNGASSPTASSTSYDIASTKATTSGTSIGSERLRLTLNSGTSSGFLEAQALFTTTPVALSSVGDKINLTYTFTNTAGTLLQGGSGSLIASGLFNSAGQAPVAGALANSGLTATTGSPYATGNCTDWQGYVSQIYSNSFASRIITRPIQDGTDDTSEHQELLFNNAGGGAFDDPSGTQVGLTADSGLDMVSGGVYTISLTIELTGASQLDISHAIYNGPVASGLPIFTQTETASGGTYLTNSFDGLCIGVRHSTGTVNPLMDISKITISTSSASENALYNVQLNGWTNNTFSGAAQTGSGGDLWNNPNWDGVGTPSTTMFSGVTLLDSTGADYGVTATLTSKFNDTNAWNSGTFNRYTSQTAGSATAVLVDQVAKIDYSGPLGGVNAMTLSVSGLPTNTPVTVYVYGTGNNSGSGGVWSLPSNGGDSAVIAYDGSGTGRDATLASSQGTGWEVLSGTSDALGNLVVAGTNYSGSGVSTWWQIYMNGMQIRVGGEAPAIFGLVDQTVEEGSTVNLTPLVTGNPVPTYQWQTNGVDLPEGTNSTLSLVGVTTDQSGTVYSLIAANPLGTVTNSMTLTVNAAVYSDMTVTGVSPSNGATEICPDTPLTVTFSDTVSLGTIGSVKIFNVTDPVTPVDTIDVSLGAVQQRTFPGDGQSFSYQTFEISGSSVKIYPHFNVLASSQTYYVTIDPKAFLDSGGTNFVGLSDTNAWQFTTKSAPADPAKPTVNANGSADFLTVQGAINSLASGTSATQRVVSVKNGTYKEIVNIAGKHNVTLRGESRLGTLVGYPNNANFQSANGGTTHARMSFKVNADDIAIESLTLTNMTPQGGSQAEALMIESGAERCIINNVDIVSRQDTILANINTSQGYFYQSSIRGNFDYIWGGGNLFFDECNIHTISGASGYNVTAARTTTSASSNATFHWANPGGTYTANGMSFVNCSFTADAGVTTVTLAGGNGTAGNNVSWYGCEFSSHYTAPSVLFGGNYLWWQATNSQSGSPVTFANVTTIGGSDPEILAATNAPTWLYGWSPELAPNILTNPISQSVTQGDPVIFTVAATGIPAPTYQWKHAGTNLTGEVSSTLNLASAQSSDAGSYEVEVSNSSGSVVSATATLTVIPSVATNPTNITAVVSNGFVNLSWPSSHIGWSLQAQTNALSTGLGTNWATLGYEGTNAASLEIDPANPSVFFRLFYQVP